MTLITKFLCWTNTRTGSLFAGFYSLCISVVCVSMYLVRYVATSKILEFEEYRVITYVAFVMYSIFCVASLMLILGTYVDKVDLLLPWLFFMFFLTLFDVSSIAILVILHTKIEGKSPGVWEGVFILLGIIRLAFNMYCWVCVISQLQELRAGRGTYDWIYKQRRQRRADVFHVQNRNQLVLQPPPYSTSPPAYYNIYPMESAPPYSLTPTTITVDVVRTDIDQITDGDHTDERIPTNSNGSSTADNNRHYQERDDGDSKCDETVVSDNDQQDHLTLTLSDHDVESAWSCQL